MKTNAHRQVIVRTMIDGILAMNVDGVHPHFSAFYLETENRHKQGDCCIVTGLFFPDEMSEMLITISNYGAIWMGLWLDSPLKLDDEREGGHGNTLFPRWLAEVLNNQYQLGIEEEDIYDE